MFWNRRAVTRKEAGNLECEQGAHLTQPRAFLIAGFLLRIGIRLKKRQTD
jgi:hypothetical protein